MGRGACDEVGQGEGEAEGNDVVERGRVGVGAGAEIGGPVVKNVVGSAPFWMMRTQRSKSCSRSPVSATLCSSRSSMYSGSGASVLSGMM